MISYKASVIIIIINKLSSWVIVGLKFARDDCKYGEYESFDQWLFLFIQK